MQKKKTKSILTPRNKTINEKMNALAIYKKATALINKHKTRNSAKIAENLGIKIYYRSNFTDLLGMYTVVQRQRCIFLNNNLGYEDSQIVIAHEIGHDLIHRRMAQNSGHKEFMLFDLNSRPEYEANAFAAHILLDEKEIEPLITDGVSLEAAAKQLNTNINLLSIKIIEMSKLDLNFNQKFDLKRLPQIPKSNFLKNLTGK
ncbi:MAG: ImmA/IrrE family metallo-endopeptidase [Candidatus Ozemobacteraceae bacterium]|jgi:Zn-dependent peptidase ImmA (M78 family)|nr:ImmA/IrrE family metallo-endopeptidase [Candidatus Riflebacteria bacterium]